MSPIASGKTFSLVLLLDFLVFSLFFCSFPSATQFWSSCFLFLSLADLGLCVPLFVPFRFRLPNSFSFFSSFFLPSFARPRVETGDLEMPRKPLETDFFVSFYFFARLKLPSLLNRVLFFCFIFLPFSASPQRYFTHFFLFRQLHVWPWKSRGTGYPVRYRVSFCAVIVTDIGGRSSDVCYRVVLPSFFLWLIFFLHLWKESCPWKDHLFFSLREIVVSLDMNEPTVAFETKITVLSFFILIWKKTTKNNPNGKKRST